MLQVFFLILIIETVVLHSKNNTQFFLLNSKSYKNYYFNVMFINKWRCFVSLFASVFENKLSLNTKLLIIKLITYNFWQS